MKKNNWKDEFLSLEDLRNKFKDNALALFALAMRFKLDELDSIGSESITDGNDDKKIDLIYVNPDEKFAVIAQCYYSSNSEKPCAKANKASDLNTGLIWLLERNKDDLPNTIKTEAMHLRKEISDGNIQTIYVWYVHNLLESNAVKNELKTVEATLNLLIKNNYPNSNLNACVAEVGTNTLQKWFEESNTPILVNEKITFNIRGGYELINESWSAYATAIDIKDIYKLFSRHKESLFSANVRDYLGARNSDSNINNGIIDTVNNEPNNFWVYNNGITILTYSYDLSPKTIEINGMSIVNGAQTTGAIYNALKSRKVKDKLDCSYVPVRFISVSLNNKSSLIENIIRYNNCQNKVEAADFRSTDIIQKRLKKEFLNINFADYEAGRRGVIEGSKKRNSKLLSSYFVGQALTAFHGYPIIAYNQKRDIWSNNEYYNNIFNDNTSANHIIFCYSLIKSIENKKINLQNKKEKTESEEKMYNFLRKRGAKYLLAYAISCSLETILSKKITNKFSVSFFNIKSIKDAESKWEYILNIVLPFSYTLNEAAESGLKSKSEISKCVTSFVSAIEAYKINVKENSFDKISDFIIQ